MHAYAHAHAPGTPTCGNVRTRGRAVFAAAQAHVTGGHMCATGCRAVMRTRAHTHARARHAPHAACAAFVSSEPIVATHRPPCDKGPKRPPPRQMRAPTQQLCLKGAARGPLVERSVRTITKATVYPSPLHTSRSRAHRFAPLAAPMDAPRPDPCTPALLCPKPWHTAQAAPALLGRTLLGHT